MFFMAHSAKLVFDEFHTFLHSAKVAEHDNNGFCSSESESYVEVKVTLIATLYFWRK
jgi:hypothetical protein